MRNFTQTLAKWGENQQLTGLVVAVTLIDESGIPSFSTFSSGLELQNVFIINTLLDVMKKELTEKFTSTISLAIRGDNKLQ